MRGQSPVDFLAVWKGGIEIRHRALHNVGSHGSGGWSLPDTLLQAVDSCMALFAFVLLFPYPGSGKREASVMGAS